MDQVVLVKVVPAADVLRFEPERFTVVREPEALFLNPFDQRALRVALELRRPGEKVRVVSMGPPSAAGPLREALVHGADEVTLISDVALAGSDTLVTARVLAAAVRRLGHDLVVAGAWTTDSETGQVPAEVAALLGVPVLTSARSIVRNAEGSGLEISVDTLDGSASYRSPLPIVVSVGEKIAKPLRAAPEAIAAVPEDRVRRLSASELGLAPELLGTRGSPTRVDSVEEVAPVRHPVVFQDGSIPDRVAGAVAHLRPLLRRPARSPGALPPPASRDPSREVLLLATDDEGRLDPSSLGTVSEVRRSWPDRWPAAVWLGGPPAESDTYRLDLAGALGGHLLPMARRPIESRTAAGALQRLLEARPSADAVLLPSTPFGRAVAGQLAAPRGLGLVGDAIALGRDDGGLIFSKPSFGGRTIARIRCTTRPAIATVRPGVFAPATSEGSGGGFGWSVVRVPEIAPTLVRVGSVREIRPGEGLDARDVVVAVGLGIGGPEGIERLRPILGRWGAALGATRRVVDAGWVPRQVQIGLTGSSMAPRLGILLGVGGSVNHLIGWRRAGTLLAVNRDPEAPVFREVDVGIVGPVEEVVPALVEPLARALGP